MSAPTISSPAERREQRVLGLASEICLNAKTASEDPQAFQKLHEAVMQLENLVFSLDGAGAEAAALLDRVPPDLVTSLNDAFELWEGQLEQKFAVSVIERRQDLHGYLFYGRCERLVRRELQLVSDVQPRRVLLAGSGPLPIGAIQIHRETRSEVDCTVRSPASLIVARRVLDACGFNGVVRVLDEADGGYNLSDYDLIVIDRPSGSRKRVLRSVRKQARPGCRILCRTSHGLRRLAYRETREWDVRGFYVKAEQRAEREGHIVSTMLLEPAGSAAADLRLEWLRTIGPRQATQIVSLMNRTLQEETTIGFPGPIDEETGRRVMDALRRDVQAGSRHVLVAEKNGVIVGKLILTPNSTPNHRHIVELTRGTIDPSFRGGGLALMAFQEVCRKCEELGRELICLDVRAGSRASLWWQHFGFKPFGLLPDYSRVGDKRYQGLYLHQSVADLKQRVIELGGRA